MEELFMKRYASLLCICTSVALVSGCAQTRLSDDAKMAEVVIADKTAIAANAQQEYLALVTEDRRIRSEKQTALETDLVDVDYIGKPIPIIQGFANRYGYTFVETGKKRDLRIINIRMQNMPTVEVLRNIGTQIDYAANLILDKNTKVIRIVYKN